MLVVVDVVSFCVRHSKTKDWFDCGVITNFGSSIN